MAAAWWVFKRKGEKRFTFAWASDPADPAKRSQVKLPQEITTEREARAYAATNEATLKSREPAVKRDVVTVGVLVDKWIALRCDDPRFAKSTSSDAASLLRRWVRPRFETMALQAVDIPCMREWVRSLRTSTSLRPDGSKRPVAPYTQRNILTAMAWLLDDVEGEGWAALPHGNVARVKAVRGELPTMEPRAGDSTRLRIRDVTDAQRLLDCPRVMLEHRARYALALTTGLRDGEIAGLCVVMVDLAACVLTVRQAVQLKSRNGKGARVGRTKTRASVRTLPIHPAAAAALREWLDDGWEMLVGRPPEPGDFVFPNAAGQQWRPDSAEFLRQDLEAAGLPTHVDGFALTFHALRRSCVSWVRAMNAPNDVIDSILGHAGATTAQRHYTAADVEVLRGYLDRIGLVWRRVRAPAGDVCGVPLVDGKQLAGRARTGRIRRRRKQPE